MKSKAMAHFRFQTKLIPGPGPSALRGITLLHGGERQCEPIYEDICNIGSWDKDDIATLLETGETPEHAQVKGAMHEAIEDGLKYLTDEDRQAIATYLLAQKPVINRVGLR